MMEDSGHRSAEVGTDGIIGFHGLDVAKQVALLHFISYLEGSFLCILGQEELAFERSSHFLPFTGGSGNLVGGGSLAGRCRRKPPSRDKPVRPPAR